MEFEIEIIFMSSSTPKRMKVIHLYDKGSCLCLMTKDNIMIRYPWINIFQVCNKHGAHVNSSVKEYKLGGE